MMHWFLSRFFTVADVGRWHARRNYPREGDGVRLPLWRRTLPANTTVTGAVGKSLARAPDGRPASSAPAHACKPAAGSNPSVGAQP